MRKRFRLVLDGCVILALLWVYNSISYTVAPYPLSTVITGITFDSQIVRKAQDSDNWPITWGNDDKLYTAYGDGYGFEPKLSSKACLGIARVSGKPDNFSGENLATLNSVKGGCHKPTGLLMVDNVLYLWTRRDNGRLWKSTDHGQNWDDTGIGLEQADGTFYSNHFCQFGPGYANSPDGYIYVYGTSRRSNGNIYLLRVSKNGNAIENISNYEYYGGLDKMGKPVWHANITANSPVFTDNSHNAQDCRVVYNPGIGRYILTYSDYDSPGFMAIMDASVPWGPWTTVYYTESWDQGFSFEYSFPAKWISPDGRIMYMVFSGTGINDAFAVRKATLTVNDSRADTIGGQGISSFKIPSQKTLVKLLHENCIIFLFD